MRVCTQCGKENVAHTPRHPNLCAHEYEDIIAGLKNSLRMVNKISSTTIAFAVKARNETINQRNRQIKDLQFRLRKLETK